MVEITYDSDAVLALGTLAASAVGVQPTRVDATRTQGWRTAMLRIVATLAGKTTAEGPILWGIACNLDATQINAVLIGDPQNATEDDDHGAGQWLKILGLIDLAATEGPLTGPSEIAQPIDIKVNWSTIEGEAVVVWARNNGGSPLTTGGLITFSIENFGVWLRD